MSNELKPRWTTKKGSSNNRVTLKCLNCTTEHEVYLAWVRRGGGKYCSVQCRLAALTYRKALSDSTRGKVSKFGSTNPNWKGGVTLPSQSQRSWNKAREWKRAVLARDEHKCVQCGSLENLQVDHIKSWTYYPEFRFDLDNGRVLCVDCHRKTPNYGWRSYNAATNR